MPAQGEQLARRQAPDGHPLSTGASYRAGGVRAQPVALDEVARRLDVTDGPDAHRVTVRTAVAGGCVCVLIEEAPFGSVRTPIVPFCGLVRIGWRQAERIEPGRPALRLGSMIGHTSEGFSGRQPCCFHHWIAAVFQPLNVSSGAGSSKLSSRPTWTTRSAAVVRPLCNHAECPRHTGRCASKCGDHGDVAGDARDRLAEGVVAVGHQVEHDDRLTLVGRVRTRQRRNLVDRAVHGRGWPVGADGSALRPRTRSRSNAKRVCRSAALSCMTAPRRR